MVKAFTETELQHIKANVYLSGGEKYLGCDVPQNLVSNNERLISFWVNDELMIVPTARLVKLVMYTEKSA